MSLKSKIDPSDERIGSGNIHAETDCRWHGNLNAQSEDEEGYT